MLAAVVFLCVVLSFSIPFVFLALPRCERNESLQHVKAQPVASGMIVREWRGADLAENGENGLKSLPSKMEVAQSMGRRFFCAGVLQLFPVKPRARLISSPE